MSLTFDAADFLAALRVGGTSAEQATRRLLQHYRPLLRARLARSGVPAREWDDLGSEILFKAVTQAHTVRAAEAFHSWLMTIAQHEIAAHWKRSAREREVFEPAPATDGDSTDDDDETLQLLAQTPDEMSSDPVLARCLQGQLAHFRDEAPVDFACIELLARGHEAEEIALLTERTPGAAREFISRCCAALMKRLKPCLDDGRTRNWAPRRGQARAHSGDAA